MVLFRLDRAVSLGEPIMFDKREAAELFRQIDELRLDLRASRKEVADLVGKYASYADQNSRTLLETALAGIKIGKESKE